jgi:hypothetical protein
MVHVTPHIGHAFQETGEDFIAGRIASSCSF